MLSEVDIKIYKILNLSLFIVKEKRVGSNVYSFDFGNLMESSLILLLRIRDKSIVFPKINYFFIIYNCTDFSYFLGIISTSYPNE